MIYLKRPYLLCWIELSWKLYLNNYFDFHVRLSIRPFCPFSPFRLFCPFRPFGPKNFRVLSFSEFQKPGQTAAGRGNAKLCILDFKTTWSEFQKPSQTAPAEAKPRCAYSILKPHGQSSVRSVRSVRSFCFVCPKTNSSFCNQITKCH